VDLDGDGHIDVLSGSWPGELFLFRGTADGSFAAGEMIRDKQGHLINIGGGIEDWRGGAGLLIRGHAEFERTDEGLFVNYRGRRIKSTPERPVATTGTASTVRAADWDGDGDCDLIVGDIRGNVYLIPNEGTAKSYAFGKDRQLEVDGKPLRVKSRAGPHVADWDGDGDLDLLVGADDGSVSLCRNIGSARSPKLAGPVELVPPGEVVYGAGAPKEARRGRRAKVCTADWNGDGRLDLLIGDFSTQTPDLPEPTAEEKAEHERIREELEPVRQRYGELAGKVRSRSSTLTPEQREKAHEEMNEVRRRMSELQAKLPPEYERHGWVWLFLRQP
jgi:hypothetical protein